MINFPFREGSNLIINEKKSVIEKINVHGEKKHTRKNVHVSRLRMASVWPSKVVEGPLFFKKKHVIGYTEAQE